MSFQFPRRPVTRWRRPSTFIGRARAWVLKRILGWDCETCQKCGRRVLLVWWCPNTRLWEDAYEEATGHRRGGAGLLCPRCFDDAARSLGRMITWVPSVTRWRLSKHAPWEISELEGDIYQWDASHLGEVDDEPA